MPCARVLLLLSTVLQMSVGFCTTSPLVRLQSEIHLRQACVARAQNMPVLLEKPQNSSCMLQHAALQKSHADLSRRVGVLENTMSEVLSCLLYCDDIALLERQASYIGDIYLDSGFTSTRKPRMLRPELRHVAETNGILMKPIMHSWWYQPNEDPP